VSLFGDSLFTFKKWYLNIHFVTAFATTFCLILIVFFTLSLYCFDFHAIPIFSLQIMDVLVSCQLKVVQITLLFTFFSDVEDVIVFDVLYQFEWINIVCPCKKKTYLKRKKYYIVVVKSSPLSWINGESNIQTPSLTYIMWCPWQLNYTH